ncbi:hypothetical protein ILUMI_20109 [Ignelater luminosus]|uniref:Uncharacterized protein n=1 Tax=Ignelater luminosus TaxID=2038154 RepID=A0A8K0G568_IGNLU|nr:hypothetical protein ILUMI_20109 [Ignelater luminosus]
MFYLSVDIFDVKPRSGYVQFASANTSAAIPNSWYVNQIAGENWFASFIKDFSTLAIRTPESTSLARASNRPLDIAHKPLEQSTAPDLQLADQETLSKSVYQASSSPTCCLSNHKSLEDLKPVLKAGPRKESLRGRKRRKTCILTDIPEIKTLKEAKHSRNIKKNSFNNSRQKMNRKTIKEISSDEESEGEIIYAESNDSLGSLADLLNALQYH